jgi:hypothetical protein
MHTTNIIQSTFFRQDLQNQAFFTLDVRTLKI